MQALSQLSYGPGTQGTERNVIPCEVPATPKWRAGAASYILQPHKIKMKIQSFLQF
jgi:hypothetical protein